MDIIHFSMSDDALFDLFYCVTVVLIIVITGVCHVCEIELHLESMKI
jgi:hypothetical protein